MGRDQDGWEERGAGAPGTGRWAQPAAAPWTWQPRAGSFGVGSSQQMSGSAGAFLAGVWRTEWGGVIFSSCDSALEGFGGRWARAVGWRSAGGSFGCRAALGQEQRVLTLLEDTGSRFGSRMCGTGESLIFSCCFPAFPHNVRPLKPVAARCCWRHGEEKGGWLGLARARGRCGLGVSQPHSGSRGLAWFGAVTQPGRRLSFCKGLARWFHFSWF